MCRCAEARSSARGVTGPAFSICHKPVMPLELGCAPVTPSSAIRTISRRTTRKPAHSRRMAHRGLVRFPEMRSVAKGWPKIIRRYDHKGAAPQAKHPTAFGKNLERIIGMFHDIIGNDRVEAFIRKRQEVNVGKKADPANGL